MDECPQIGKLAYDYLRKTKGSEDNIFAYFSNDPDAEKLYEGLIDEFDKCILSYFAFHWSYASLMVKEVNVALAHASYYVDDHKIFKLQ